VWRLGGQDSGSCVEVLDDKVEDGVLGVAVELVA